MLKDWFYKNRNKLTGCWFFGNEPNTMPPEDFDKASIKVLIVRLSSYKDVASGITHQYLYQMAVSVEGSYVDMAFLPPENDEKLMLADKIPLLFGTTSKKAATEFDIIAISNSVLQELINLPAMLFYSNLPLSTKERKEKNSPFVFLGGSNSYTHSILHGVVSDDNDDLFGLVDGVLMGDGEKSFAEMIRIVRDNKHSLERKQIINILSEKVTGFYNPLNYKHNFSPNGELQSIESINNAPFPVKVNKAACESDSEVFTCGPVMYEESSDSHVILSAGCPSFCSFCKESWEQKPYREINKDRVISSAKSLKANMGLSELALMTFNANTCTDIFYLVNKLGTMFSRVGIKSQRFDAIVKAPALLDLQFDAGKRAYTCAMEGISERIRTLLQKNLNEETILTGIDLLLRRGMRQMKTFLIVTGYENESDIAEYQRFLDKVKQLFNNKKSKPKVTFSFAVLFRAPQTPMQYAPTRENSKELDKLQKKLCSITESNGFEARISAGADDAVVSEYIACADRRSTKILVEASVQKGFRYRGEITSKLTEFWKSALNKYSLPEHYKKIRTSETTFPWDDVDTGINKRFLWNVWQSINSGKEIRPCLSEPWGSGSCSGCGACCDNAMRNALHKMGPKLNSDNQSLNVNQVDEKTTFVWVEFEIPKKWALCSREFIKAALARQIMLVNPELVERFLYVETISPDFFCGGRALAKVAFKGFGITLKNNISDNCKDIIIKGRARTPKNQQEAAFPIVLSCIAENDKVQIPREIDGILSKYSIKNLKQRKEGLLTWQINEGHASKHGIELISFNEETKEIKLRLIKTPELYMLNKLSFGGIYFAS